MNKEKLFCVLYAVFAFTRKAYAHHYEVMGYSISHRLMLAPAAIVTALGMMLLFGLVWKQKKRAGTGFLLASFPLWYMGFFE